MDVLSGQHGGPQVIGKAFTYPELLSLYVLFFNLQVEVVRSDAEGQHSD